MNKLVIYDSCPKPEAFIPIYVLIKDVEIRLYWAMVSNVLIFEKLSGNKSIDHCKRLVGKIPHGMGIRTLITIPAIIIVIIVIIFAIVISLYEVSYIFSFCKNNYYIILAGFYIVLRIKQFPLQY